MTTKTTEPAPDQDTASLLLGISGVTVAGAEEEHDGLLTVWADASVRVPCPGCGEFSEKVHEYVTTRPRDIRSGNRAVRLFLRKRRLECGNGKCRRGTFTEWVPQVPPRCQVTRRLLEHCGNEVADRGITPFEAARHNGVSWPTAYGAFKEKAEKILPGSPEPVLHLGIDEHRRGRARWHTCFYDLSGDQGLLGQVEGRTADDAAYWLAGAEQDWRDAVEYAAIDMCTICKSAVTRMLPEAKIAVDLFHVVQLAVKAAGDVRRRAIRELYGRRGKSGDPEYGIRHLLEKNLENLSPEQFEKVIEVLDATGPGQQVLLAWIAKEKLRDALNTRARVTGSVPCERQVRDRLFAFYDWCAQNEQVTALTALAGTVSRWEREIVTAVLAGVTNARSESLNRIAKLEARQAYGFRNPANQRLRVRIACTRGTRRNAA